MSYRSIHILHLVGLASLFVAAGAAADEPKPYRDGAANLSLDGVQVGVVAEVEAPYAGSDVVNESLGTQSYAKKHIGNIKYGDISLSLGPTAPAAIFKWISDSWAQAFTRKNGALVIGGTSREFYNALISEVSFPGLDSSSPAKVAIGVKLSPEYMRRVALAGNPGGLTPLFLSNSFRVALAGLDASKVLRVDPFTIKQTVTENAVGALRDYQKEPGKIEYPNISIYLRPGDAASFVQWHDDFVIKGNCGDDKEKTGSIELLSGEGKTVVRVGLSNVGISGIRDVMMGNSRALQIDLYVERMDLSAPAANVAATPLGAKTVSARMPSASRPAAGKVLLQ